MFICGYNFIGGANACCLSPTGIDDISYVELKNGWYDTLYITKNAEVIDNDDSYPEDFDFDTILYAKFNGDTLAGNTSWSTATVTNLLLKSRKANDFKWKTLLVKEIKSIDDFDIDYTDYLASGETDYAVVPVFYGTEGDYSIVTVNAEYNRLFLIEGDKVYSTIITDGFCNTERHITTNTLDLLNNKYPMFVRNSIANYDSGTCTGSFIPVADNNQCNLLTDEEHNVKRITYQKEIMDFLTDGVPKILKNPDGRMWIIRVIGNPTDSASDIYNDREISFNWVEVGNVSSEEDLYYLGLSDVTEEWWG